MNDDRLDVLLGSAAPAPLAVDQSDVRRMMAEARVLAGPAPAPRRGRIALAAAAALALVIGGGGVAVASGLVTWPSALEKPDAEFNFTLSSGRQCEFRMLVVPMDAEGDEGSDLQLMREIEADVAGWLRDGDLLSRLDLAAARVEADRILEEQAKVGMTVSIGGDGWLEDAALSDAIDPDAREALTIDRAVRHGMVDHLTASGFPKNTWTFISDGGVKCAAE